MPQAPESQTAALGTFKVKTDREGRASNSDGEEEYFEQRQQVVQRFSNGVTVYMENVIP